MADQLEKPDAAALSEVFAVEVAGWKRETLTPLLWNDASGEFCDESGCLLLPTFATSADAVLPWLNASGRWIADHSVTSEPPGAEFMVCLAGHKAAYAPSFSRAACIALIHAKRAEKGTA